MADNGARPAHILATNDDGYTAPGLLALVQEIRKLGKVSILAPDRNWSGGGHVKTMDRPLRVREVRLKDETPAYASDGAPSDCVALALLGFIPDKIDLVVSGINSSANLGHDVTYSGTVTAAMEAVIWGTPAVAFSLHKPEGSNGSAAYLAAARIAAQITSTVLQNRLPAGILLNVNIPFLPLAEIKGVKITRQGLRVYRDRLDSRVDPRGQPYHWIVGAAPTGIREEGADFGAVESGYVSITPLHLDLTAYPAQQLLSGWKWPALEQGFEKSPAR